MLFKRILYVWVGFMISSHSFAVLIYAHRGGRGVMPENTLFAYQYALNLGVDFIDLDINMTRDGILVVTHDLALNPDITRDEHGRWITKKMLIKDMRWNELRKYNVCGIKAKTPYANIFKEQRKYTFCHIPSLIELIAAVKASGKPVGYQIEIKTDPAHPENSYSPAVLAQALVKLLQSTNLINQVEIQAFDFRCLQEIQRLDPRMKTAYLTEIKRNHQLLNPDNKIASLWTAGVLYRNYMSLPRMIAALGGKVWNPQDITVTAAEINEAHRLGLKVVAWSSWQYMKSDFDRHLILHLIEMGVDGVTTDRPDKLQKILKSSY